MAEEEPAAPPRQPLVASRTLLDLLTNQSVDGAEGIRLQFHNVCAESIQLTEDCEYPYHFCALTGNIALAVYFYVHQVPYSQAMRVCSFRSSGTTGTTPWSNRIRIPADDVAMLAGDAKIAEVLDLIAWQTPLAWSAESACQEDVWPPALQTQGQPVREALFTSAWFLRLPGPARQLVMHNVMSQLVREHVWGLLPDAVWAQRWEEVLEPEVLSMARKLVARQVGPDAVPPASLSDKEEDEEPQFPSYQIKISTAAASPAAPAPSTRGSWREDQDTFLRCLLRGSAGVFALDTAVRLGVSQLPLKLGAFALGIVFPCPSIFAAAYLAPRRSIRDLLRR